jgi:hypothetical protein
MSGSVACQVGGSATSHWSRANSIAKAQYLASQHENGRAQAAHSDSVWAANSA